MLHCYCYIMALLCIVIVTHLHRIGVIITNAAKPYNRYARNGRRWLHYFLFVLHASRDILCIGNEVLSNSNLVLNIILCTRGVGIFVY